MRIITAEQISAAVAELCIRANRELPEDIVSAMNRAAADEPWPVAKNTLEVLCRNIAAAEEMSCRYVRIRAWPVSLYGWARMCI